MSHSALLYFIVSIQAIVKTISHSTLLHGVIQGYTVNATYKTQFGTSTNESYNWMNFIVEVEKTNLITHLWILFYYIFCFYFNTLIRITYLIIICVFITHTTITIIVKCEITIKFVVHAQYSSTHVIKHENKFISKFYNQLFCSVFRYFRTVSNDFEFNN